MVRTIIHGARIGGGVQMGFSIPIKFPSYGGGGGQSGQGLLVLPPRCEFFLVRTLYSAAGPLKSFSEFAVLLCSCLYV